MDTNIIDPADTNLANEWDKLLFGVDRSIRYHMKRERFFATCDKVVKASAMILGASVVSQAFDPATMLAGGLAVLVLTAADQVVNNCAMAIEHRVLRRRFAELEREMTGVAATAENLLEFLRRRQEIEADEPPTNAVVNRICHNETIVAGSYAKELLPIGWWRVLLGNFMPVGTLPMAPKPKPTEPS